MYGTFTAFFHNGTLFPRWPRIEFYGGQSRYMSSLVVLDKLTGFYFLCCAVSWNWRKYGDGEANVLVKESDGGCNLAIGALIVLVIVLMNSLYGSLDGRISALEKLKEVEEPKHVDAAE
ncbi:hypothetical protein OROGR_001841 [Orobanche gracilis]